MYKPSIDIIDWCRCAALDLWKEKRNPSWSAMGDWSWLGKKATRTPASEEDEERTKRIQNLQDRVTEVDDKIVDLQSVKEKLKMKLSYLKRGGRIADTPGKPHVIAFVDKIEQALMYFKLKDFLISSNIVKHDSLPTKEFVDRLFKSQQGMAEFEKMDHTYIEHAIKAHIHFISSKQDKRPGLRDTVYVSEAGKELESSFPTSIWETQELVDEFVFKDPFLNLVYRMLTEGYAMNKNPEAELQLIMKSYPLIYQDKKIVSDSAGLMTLYGNKEPSNNDEAFTEAVGKYKKLIRISRLEGRPMNPRDLSSEPSGTIQQLVT